MASTYLQLARMSDQPLEQLADELTNTLGKGMVHPQVIINNVEHANGTDVLLLMLEKYYVRNSSMAVMAIQVVSCNGAQKATVVGTGGGDGLLNISLGANRNFARLGADALMATGFQEISRNYA